MLMGPAPFLFATAATGSTEHSFGVEGPGIGFAFCYFVKGRYGERMAVMTNNGDGRMNGGDDE